MSEKEIVYMAIENLHKNARIHGEWREHIQREVDGKIVFNIGNQTLEYNIDVKKELQNHQVSKIQELHQRFHPFMLVTARLSTEMKEILREEKIAYLEANGNIFLHNQNSLLWIDTNKTIVVDKKMNSKAFTKTGLQVVFQLLLDETLVHRPYREIAAKTGVALGNVSNIIKGLRQESFLIPIRKSEYQFHNKQSLLNQWKAAYDAKLKPDLKIGTFRFLKVTDFNQWKKMALRKGKTWWGGEPAGDLLTNYLRPAELTLYTLENRNELIKNYKLIPDEKGNIHIYKKFWADIEPNSNVVQAILVYSDLMNTNDRRCIATAQKIYDEYLQAQF